MPGTLPWKKFYYSKYDPPFNWDFPALICTGKYLVSGTETSVNVFLKLSGYYYLCCHIGMYLITSLYGHPDLSC